LGQYADQGVKLLAMDIVDDPSGKSHLPDGTSFYNIQRADQRTALLALEPFDICLLSNYPSVHLATALQFDFFTERFIFPKPVDSHIQLLKTVREGRDRTFASIVSKMLVHDHYRNKPLVARLKSLLPTLHGKYGFIREFRIYITERRSAQDEWQRKGALDDGLILDLAPHAISVLMELLPKRLRWESDEGHSFERLDIRFDDVRGCYRARDNFSILRDGAETFAAIDLLGTEIIDFFPGGDHQPLRLQPRDFHILIVVGKGTSIDTSANGLDLKSIQLTFDGNDVIGNFDTNAIGGVIDDDIVNRLTEKVDPRQRGLNLPFQRLGKLEFDFESLSASAESIVADFQGFDEAYQVTAILSQALQHDSAKIISTHYPPGIPSSDLVNRLLSRGLDQRWQHPGPLNQMVLGRPPVDAID
ncbi:MAG: hypothetical protein ACREBG_27350, partial [Pyrinomonadaceae bacterium]